MSVNNIMINLAHPIRSVVILDTIDSKNKISSDKVLSTDVQQRLIKDLEAQKAEFLQACQVLEAIILKLNQFWDDLFIKARDGIVKLSVEIARKILMQKIQKGDYEIESIVKEAISNIPTRQGVVVRLNPQDFSLCQKLQQDSAAGSFAGIKFVSDPSIGRAECLVDTPEGIIESLIDNHLEQVEQALKKAE